MDLTKKLEKILDNYIKQLKIKSNKCAELESKINTYERIINLLNTYYDEILNNKGTILTLLTSVYENTDHLNQINKLINYNSKAEISQLINNIKKDYEDIKIELALSKLEIKESTELKESAGRVKTNIKYKQPIKESNNDIVNVQKIINHLVTTNEITNEEALLLINEIDYYNEKLFAKKYLPEDLPMVENMYNEIPNIVTIGFQELDNIEVAPNTTYKLDSYALDMQQQTLDGQEESVIEIIESYKQYKLETNEYNYIIVKTIDGYIDELLELYKLLLDKTIYNDKASRTEVIKDYYHVLNKYIIIKKYYDSQNQYTLDESSEDTENIEYANQNRLIYSYSNTDITKAKIISDMSDIPYEYYDTVYDLITKFKNGTIGNKEIKTLCGDNRVKGCAELRYDQVRIVFKHSRDNVYNIFGVFVKKSDNDTTAYARMINRIMPDVSSDEKLLFHLDLAKETEEELEKIVREKGRKGTR